MTREQAIQRLKEHKILFSNDHGWDTTTIQALDIAIKSLNMWDKVIKELDEQYDDVYDFYYQQGIEFALELIKKYKKEIEE